MGFSTDSIRPVEVLWLRDKTDKDNYLWGYDSVVRALLADLFSKGVLEYDDESDELTVSNRDKELRGYEEEFLNLIDDDETSFEEAFEVVMDFDFEDFFVSSGLIEMCSHSEEVKIPLIPKFIYSYTSTWEVAEGNEIYRNKVLPFIKDKKEQFGEKLTDINTKDEDFAFLFAFPDIYEEMEHDELDEPVQKNVKTLEKFTTTSSSSAMMTSSAAAAGAAAASSCGGAGGAC